MAFKRWLADDEYANEKQHFIKVYFDFDTEEECRRFYDELNSSEKFDDIVEELAFNAVYPEEAELLRFFEDGGVMLDTETGVVYQSDVNDQGHFYGIFEYEPVPEEARHDLQTALEYAECLQWSENDAPGGWFEELAEEVIANPERFVTE